jgi:hypothetical protein
MPGSVNVDNSNSSTGTALTSLSTGTITTSDTPGIVVVGLTTTGSYSSPSWTTSTLNSTIEETRLFTGYYLPSGSLSGFGDTAHWTTSRAAGAVIMAFKLSGGSTAGILSVL